LRGIYSLSQIADLLSAKTLDPVVGAFTICRNQAESAF
jgi:hypothetical protein